MSSPPKKMRKSGGNTAASASTVQNDAAQNETARNEANDPADHVNMDEDLDPASMYEDEEG